MARDIKELFDILAEFNAAPVPNQLVTCPTHRTRMQYQASLDLLVCPEDRCDMISQRNNYFDPKYGIPENGMVPFPVYRGAYKLCMDTRGRMYLFLEDINRLVDITDMVKQGLSRPTTI